MTKDEFLARINEAMEKEYSDDDEQWLADEELYWQGIIADRIERLKNSKKTYRNGVINISNSSRDEIGKALTEYTNLVVEDFSIKIKKYSGSTTDNAQLKLDIVVWEKHKQTISGAGGNIDRAVIFAKDMRFKNCQWARYFKDNHGLNIPFETMVEIVKWLQAAKQLIAFF